MTNGTERIVEKKVYEDGKQHDYASKATGNAGLTLGIIGTALGAGAWLFGNNNRSVFGSLGGANIPENVNINAFGLGGSSNSPTALQVMEKECADEVKLLTDMFGLKLDTANKFYAMRETDIGEKFSLYKGYVDGLNAENRRSMQAEFELYKNGRDMNDATNAKIGELEKKVAVMEATRPYQDKLLMQAIEMMGERSVNYTDRKTCRCIYGVVWLPSTPTVTVLEGASPFGCNCGRTTTATATTGA